MTMQLLKMLSQRKTGTERRRLNLKAEVAGEETLTRPSEEEDVGEDRPNEL